MKRFLGILLQTALLMAASSCLKMRKHENSEQKGLSASASASNVALLISSYGHTPEMGSQFEGDLDAVRQVVSDPSGNFRFNTILAQQAGHYAMLNQVTAAAQKVDREGTLLIFIAAHGAPNGTIEPADQSVATIGFSHILDAIKAGRNGQPFRRLVLIVSSCYSGAWFQTLQSSNGLYQERLVMTSVNAYNLSLIGQASRRFLMAFQALKQNPKASLRDLVTTTQSYDPNVQYQAVPESILNEPLVNNISSDPKPETKPTPSDQTTEEPKREQSTPQSDQPKTEETQKLSNVRLLTKIDQFGRLRMYVYVPFTVSNVEIYTSSGWVAFSQSYAPQPGFPHIFGIDAQPAYASTPSAYIRTSTNGRVSAAQSVKITHQ